jgi:hypothetical protein
MSADRLVRLVLVIGFWGLVITLYVWWRVRERRKARDGAIKRRAIIERLLRPDWAFYERHLRRPAPAALRGLFADRELVMACGLSYEKFGGISTFNPLDEHSLQDAVGGIDFDIVPFACSACGDSIYLRPGAAETDTVYITYHDEPKTKVFASSVAEMVIKLRNENRA